MCLAYLFKRLHEENLSSPLDLRAFIIDHKARHDSTAEAHGVASLLRRMGTPHQTISHDCATDRSFQESSPKSLRCSGRRTYYLNPCLTSKPRRGRSGTVYWRKQPCEQGSATSSSAIIRTIRSRPSSCASFEANLGPSLASGVLLTRHPFRQTQISRLSS